MQNDDFKKDTPADANNVLEHSAYIKDLIHRDISRCSDDRCPTAAFCERYLQMEIDHKKGEKFVSVTDFKGREKVCEHFMIRAISLKPYNNGL